MAVKRFHLGMYIFNLQHLSFNIIISLISICMKLTRSAYILGICSLLMIGITALKFFNPDLIHFNSGFVLIVLLTIFIREDLYTRFFAVISIAVIGFSIVY